MMLGDDRERKGGWGEHYRRRLENAGKETEHNWNHFSHLHN